MYLTSGNELVDQIGEINFSGNVIPETWYRNILRDNGKPNLNIHIVFNSVSCIDGHKYHYVNGDWKRYIQPIVNEICASNHLSTLDLNWSGFDANMSKLLIDQAMLHGKRITKEDWLEKKAGIHTWAEFAAADIDSYGVEN